VVKTAVIDAARVNCLARKRGGVVMRRVTCPDLTQILQNIDIIDGDFLFPVMYWYY
jgi:hypothetical protein